MNYVLKKTNVLAKPQCLTHIGERAFAHCSSIKMRPDTVTYYEQMLSDFLILEITQ